MRPKSGLPKRKALRAMPKYQFGFKDHPGVIELRKNDAMFLCEAPVEVMSLFCGCGGMDLGFEGGFEYREIKYPRLPFRMIGACDICEDAISTYRLNIGSHTTTADLTEIDIGALPTAHVVMGGFPCQDFSSCGPKTGLSGRRGLLYKALEEYMLVHQPMLAIGENVPHLAKLAEGAYLDKIVEDFEAAGYKCAVWKLYCPDFGLPQHRVRLFFVNVRNDVYRRMGSPKAPSPTHFMSHRSIAWAIDDLSQITDESVPNQSQYFVATKATAGAGQGDQISIRDEVAYAVRANPQARVHFHYELDRRLTVRECARLQSFPDEFVFPFATSTNMRQIGNAVPPIIAHAVASQIFAYITAVRRDAAPLISLPPLPI